MEKATSTIDKPVISLKAANLSFAFGVATIVLLAALHLLSPEFDPARRMVSEYALGDYGWILSLMFLTWASSSACLFFAIQSKIHTVGGKIGLGFLLLSALGTGMAALFDIRHSLHGLSFMIGIPSFLVAALLISIGLLRDPSWSSGRKSMLWAMILSWVSVGFMMTIMFIGLSQSGGEFGPNVLIGWPNRLVVLAYCVWTMVVARGAILVERQ